MPQQESPKSATNTVYQLEPKSAFRSCILAVYSQLSIIRNDILPKDLSSYEWRQKAFPILREYFRNLDISKITFTVNDQMFMMTDPVADQLRRVFAHQWVAQKLLSECESNKSELLESDIATIKKAAHIMLSSGYSRFLGNSQAGEEGLIKGFPGCADVLLSQQKINAAVESAKSLSPSGNGLIRKFIHELELECAQLSDDVSDAWDCAYSNKSALPLIDPGHLWMNLVFDLKMLFVLQVDKDYIGNHRSLKKPCCFMILEDNPLHQWSFSPLNKKIHGASLYVSNKSSNFSSDNMSDNCYPTVASAKAEIEHSIEHGFNLPDVVVSDIELLDKDQNGLDFVLWLDQTLKDNQRRNEVSLVMVYSSNITFYDDQVQKLRESGIINSSYNKRDFKLRILLDQIDSGN